MVKWHAPFIFIKKYRSKVTIKVTIYHVGCITNTAS